MKILAVSLLRLGDLLMAAPSLAALKQGYPGAQLDILLNPQAKGAARLMPFVDTVHVFERDLLQSALLDPARPLMEPFFALEQQMEQLSGAHYDLVVNLTHNRLSGWVCALIKANDYCGLVLDREGRPQFGSSWFRYLNERADKLGSEIFHYADIFRFALGQGGLPKEFQWAITTNERMAARERLVHGRKSILIQPFTSETKKDWGFDNWRHVARILTENRQDISILILGAPSEAERVHELVVAMRTDGVEARETITSLAEAAALIDQADLLLTGDTSIKHLAIPARCHVVEVSLGSSDWRRTGIYRAGCHILQPLVPCAPCPHSEPCSQSHHACGNALAPDLVAGVASMALQGEGKISSQLQARLRNRVQVLRTGFSDSGYWETVDQNVVLGPQELAQAVDKLTTKLLLEGQHRKAIGEFGTEAFRLKQFLGREYPSVSPLAWQSLFLSVSRAADRERAEAERIHQRLDGMIMSSQKQPLVQLKEMRMLQNRIGDIGDRLEVRRRLLRSLIEAVEVVI